MRTQSSPSVVLKKLSIGRRSSKLIWSSPTYGWAIITSAVGGCSGNEVELFGVAISSVDSDATRLLPLEDHFGVSTLTKIARRTLTACLASEEALLRADHIFSAVRRMLIR